MSRTRGAGEAVLPRQPIGTARPRGARRSRRHSAVEEVRTRRANAVAYSADNKTSGLLRRLLEVLPRGLRRLWDGAPCPVTLAPFPARQHLAGEIRFLEPALYYNYPLFTKLIHVLGARLRDIDRLDGPVGWAGPRQESTTLCAARCFEYTRIPIRHTIRTGTHSQRYPSEARSWLVHQAGMFSVE